LQNSDSFFRRFICFVKNVSNRRRQLLAAGGPTLR